MSSAAHPEMDGQTEVLNQHLEVMLRAYVNSSCNDWEQYLDMLMFAYNNSRHSATQEAPAALLLGYEPHGPLDLLPEETSNVAAEERARTLLDRRKKAEAAIRVAQERQSKSYNARHKIITYKEGDLVLLNPHKLNLLDVQGTGRKLMPRRIGPFEIIEVINDNAYRLHLPDSYPMHNVINISHLRPYRLDLDPSRNHLANPRDDLIASEEYEVERLVGHRRRGKGMIYQVRWKGYDALEDTWATTRDLRNAPEVLKEY